MEMTVHNMKYTWEECYGENAVYIQIVFVLWDSFFKKFRHSSFIAINEKEMIEYISGYNDCEQIRIIEAKPVFPNQAGFTEFKSLPLRHPERNRITALLARSN